MRFLLLFLVCFSQLLVQSQDLEFTWLRSGTGSYEKVTEFMDIAVEESGNLLLTGSEETCYRPIVIRLSSDGELMQYKELEIVRLNYGRGLRIIPLEDGQSVVAAWGGLADDVLGSNAYVIFLDSLLNITAIDSFETYTGPAPESDYRNMGLTKTGDTLWVAAQKMGLNIDSIKIISYDLQTFNRIGLNNVVYSGDRIWQDRTFPIVRHGSDSTIVGYDHKLQIHLDGVQQPIYSDSLPYRILDIASTDDYYWLMTNGTLSKLDKGLNELFSQSFGASADHGFFVQSPDSLYAVLQSDETIKVYTLDLAGNIRYSFTHTLPEMKFNAGTWHDEHGLVLAGQNVIRGVVKELNKGSASDDDINIVNLSFTNEIYLDQPDQYRTDVILTVQNGSNSRIDSFTVSAASGIGDNCFALYFDQVISTPLAPGATIEVNMQAWIYVHPGMPLPHSRQFCFTVYGPNGRIDEAKVDNTACETLVYTSIERQEPNELIKVWPDWSNGRILIESPEMGGQVITLFNVAGQRVLEKSLIEGFNEINHRLPAGLYVWQIHNKKGELIGSDKLMLH